MSAVDVVGIIILILGVVSCVVAAVWTTAKWMQREYDQACDELGIRTEDARAPDAAAVTEAVEPVTVEQEDNEPVGHFVSHLCKLIESGDFRKKGVECYGFPASGEELASVYWAATWLHRGPKEWRCGCGAAEHATNKSETQAINDALDSWDIRQTREALGKFYAHNPATSEAKTKEETQ